MDTFQGVIMRHNSIACLLCLYFSLSCRISNIPEKKLRCHSLYKTASCFLANIILKCVKAEGCNLESGNGFAYNQANPY